MLQQFRVRKILLIKTALQGSHREAKRGCGVFNFRVSRQHLRPGHFQQRPPDESLRDQTTIEAFWRYQFAQGLAITPSVQLLLDPALNPDNDKVWVWGLRFRLNL